MTSISMCWFCQRREESNIGCSAFPLGIPDEILSGNFDHRQPFNGDHGKTFQEKKGLDSQSKKLLKICLDRLE